MQICFLKAPYLRVGQLVSFSIRDGVAVDVAPLDATALSNEKAMEIEVPRSSQQERSVRKLYRSIARFRNADVDERDQLITGAEESLQQYLESSEVDGDAIVPWFFVAVVGCILRPLQSPRKLPRQRWQRRSVLRCPTSSGGCGNC